MATRSMIYLQTAKDEYKGIYCHCDGYLEHNGYVLQNYYNNRDRVEKLIELGDLSALRPRLTPTTNNHSFDIPDRYTCIAYGRDRNEDDTQARTYTKQQINNSDGWEEYAYIFTLDNKWTYSTNNKTFSSLEKALVNRDCFNFDDAPPET